MKEKINLQGVPAILLVGGRGLRLGDLTKNTPKSLQEVGDRSILGWQLRELSQAGVGTVVLATGYRGEAIVNEILIGQKYSINVFYSHEMLPLGSGGALKQALRQIEGNWQHAIVRNGDNMAPGLDLKELLKFHCGKQALITLSLALRQAKDSRGYGIVDLAGNGKVKTFREKPADLDGGRMVEVNAGIYAVSRDILEFLPENGDLAAETLLSLAPKGCVYGYRIGEWLTVDNPEDLAQARMAIACNSQLREPQKSFARPTNRISAAA